MRKSVKLPKCQRRLNVDPLFAGSRRSKTDPLLRHVPRGSARGTFPLAAPCESRLPRAHFFEDLSVWRMYDF
jgi:hypothetical protein